MLIIEGVAFMSIVMMIDYNSCQLARCKKVSDPIQSDDVEEDEDEDVAKERLNVQEAQIGDYILKVQNIAKSFKNGEVTQKVNNNVCFLVKEGDCFGLLGPNGAGKTTLLSILSGLLDSDSGTAIIDQYSIHTQISQAYSIMGFCPQHDVLFDLLTGREHLKIYSQIKGVPADQIDHSVQDLIHKFSLDEYADNLVKSFSGGNKRKLSTCLSLLGNPKIVFMDEPSTGMDPVTRREMWDVIASMKKGRAIILTTHSMTEADALCNQIGIMVSGTLRCLGSSQHLKNKYGSGYRLAIKAAIRQTDQISEFVTNLYPSAKFLNEMAGTINFEIPQKDVQLVQIFQSIESHKATLGINDYSVSQTSLEQVFLRFAQEQRDRDDSMKNTQVHKELTLKERMSRCCK